MGLILANCDFEHTVRACYTEIRWREHWLGWTTSLIYTKLLRLCISIQLTVDLLQLKSKTGSTNLTLIRCAYENQSLQKSRMLINLVIQTFLQFLSPSCFPGMLQSEEDPVTVEKVDQGEGILVMLWLTCLCVFLLIVTYKHISCTCVHVLPTSHIQTQGQRLAA